MTSLENIQQLYDRHRFVEAFQQSAEYWRPSTSITDLSLDELILGGRLARQLGGLRLSRHLFRTAYDRDLSNSRARYYSLHVRRRSSRLLDDLKYFEAHPNACADRPETQASWLAYHAVLWAFLRDFPRAHQCLELAHKIGMNDDWVASCESDVLGFEDRWDEALEAAERAWAMNPGAPFAARSFGNSLLNLSRVQESAQWLAVAAENCQSYEIVHLACWHHCALAETLDGDERRHVIDQAVAFADQLPVLLPLEDRESKVLLARTRLDLAELRDDHEQMEQWARDTHIPFYNRILENLRKNPDGQRTRLPFRRAMQKHQACLPTSLASAMAALGVHFDPDTMAADITFGGTSDWDATEWLEKRGLTVRFFIVTADVATVLIKHGIAFVLTLEGDDSSHAVAAVGIDEATGTLLVHDPMAFRTSEYLLESFTSDHDPVGITGMAAVPSEKAALLDELLSKDDVALMTASHLYGKALAIHGPGAARVVVLEISARLPSHPGTRLLHAVQATEDGRTSEALRGFQELLQAFPKSSTVRRRLVAACRSLGDAALMRDTLAGVVERGALPGIHSQQNWRYPPATYVAEYSELLRHSAVTRERARSLLHILIRRAPTSAKAWHVLADLLFQERDIDGALIAYRIASCQAVNDEHYALSYSYALCMSHREEEGFSWLEERVKQFGGAPRASGTWITWIRALEEWGRPDRALSACAEAIRQHSSPDLLASVVPFLARMGRWDEAQELLGRLEDTGNKPLFCQAAVDFYRLCGDLQKSSLHAEAWVNEVPRHMEARYALLDLIAKRDGAGAAVKLSSLWVAQHPGHDELEASYCRLMDGPGGSKRKKYSILLRRVNRNPEDGWAWRELTLSCINDYECADEPRQRKRSGRILDLVAQCDRTAPDDPATLRVHARWHEACAQWPEAIADYLDTIARDPTHFFAYQRIWECSATFDADQRKRIWEQIEPMLLHAPGHFSVARELVMLLAQRFGVTAAEQAVARWKIARPDDPGITEAFADLLLQRGHGRTDAERALSMLQPAVERYPHHIGLRISLSDGYSRVGNFTAAESVLREMLRRHPDNSHGHVRLALVCERHSNSEEARELLQAAALRDPQNLQICESLVQILIRSNHLKEARSIIGDILRRAPDNVYWRERSIRLLLDCGDEAGSVAAAREGVHLYPRDAHTWFLLGSSLNQLRRFAEPGEIELCFRRSVSLNSLYFEAADRLALLLVEQRRYEEAEDVVRRILPRLCEPSPARGRLAWIHRQQGKTLEARQEMIAAVVSAPWFLWGWGVLMEWLIEDQDWDEARSLLGAVPSEVRTNTQFRRQRLVVLERATLPASDLDTEWNTLLSDFPAEIGLHLHRYDLLRLANRLPEAHAVLNAIRRLEPDNPFVRARHIEVLVEEKQHDQALDALQRLLFAEAENSTWPADYSWAAIKKGQLEEKAYHKMRLALENGLRPSSRGLFILCSRALERGKTQRQIPQPSWRIWFPDRGAREVLKLLDMADRTPWIDGRYRARIFDRLSSVGYYGLVLKYWKKHRTEVEADVASWAETARALVSLGRKSEARNLLSAFRTRPGVGMWVVTNYVQSFSPLRPSHLREIAATCRDALTTLPHDHCARYLAHVQAEACVLLGDTQGFRETWDHYRPYFDCKKTENEWFESKRKHLLTDIPMMARFLEQGRLDLYRSKTWSWRRKQISDVIHAPAIGRVLRRAPWWTWALLFWLALQLLRDS